MNSKLSTTPFHCMADANTHSTCAKSVYGIYMRSSTFSEFLSYAIKQHSNEVSSQCRA